MGDFQAEGRFFGEGGDVEKMIWETLLVRENADWKEEWENIAAPPSRFL